MPVRRRASDGARSDDRPPAAHVLHDESLAELCRQWIHDHARELVGGSAGWIGNDDGDGAARIWLRRNRHPENAKSQYGPCNFNDMSFYSSLPATNLQEAYS